MANLAANNRRTSLPSSSSCTDTDEEEHHQDEQQESKHILLPLSRTSSSITLTSTLQQQQLLQNETKFNNNGPTICSCDKSCIHSITKSGNSKKLYNHLMGTGTGSIDSLLSRDEYGRTALHWAANIGIQHKAYSCIKLLLDRHNLITKGDDGLLEMFVNIQDYEKDTALHLAAKYENKEVCEALIKSYTDVTLRSKNGKTSLEMIYKHIPEALLFTLDLAMEKCGYIDDAKNYLQLYTKTITGQTSSNTTKQQIRDVENEAANNTINPGGAGGGGSLTIISSSSSKNVTKPPFSRDMEMICNILHSPLQLRSSFLNHTLVVIFLWIQWRKYQVLFWGIRIFRLIWLFIYFTMMIHVYREKCPYTTFNATNNNNSNSRNSSSGNTNYKFSWFGFTPQAIISNSEKEETPKSLSNCKIDLHIKIITTIILLTTCLIFIFELYHLLEKIRIDSRKNILAKLITRLKKFKLRQILKFLLWIIMFATCFCTSFVIGDGGDSTGIQENNRNLMRRKYFDDNIYYVLAAIGVFLAWIHIFLELGKIPKLKIHMEMLTTVLKTFGKVMLTYLSILIAFAMVFCILLPGLPTYSSMPQAILRMIEFMSGSPDYQSIFYGGDDDGGKLLNSPSIPISMIFYGFGITLITIVMLNYLIGLTVSDIQTLRADALVWEYSTIISQVSTLELFLYKLPKSKLSSWFIRLIIRNRKSNHSSSSSPNHVHNNNSSFYYSVDVRQLPKDTRRAIRNWNLKIIKS